MSPTYLKLGRADILGVVSNSSSEALRKDAVIKPPCERLYYSQFYRVSRQLKRIRNPKRKMIESVTELDQGLEGW
jgi:hypothetical protein